MKITIFFNSRMFFNLSGSPCDIPLHAITWTIHTIFENLLWQFYLMCEIKVTVPLPAHNVFHKSKNMHILSFFSIWKTLILNTLNVLDL